jgi:hydrogenase maturation factor HypE
LPNSIGSIDGKHIDIKQFPKTSSLYFNKGHFSVILLGSAYDEALLTTVHVADFGKNSNGSVFRASTLETILEMEELCIPFPTSLPLDVSDETFA